MFVLLQPLFGREKCRKWSVSSVGLERLLDRQEVTSSNLVQITKRGEVRLRLFYGEGLLAQLVQSASFTRKRSTVRICHRPPWSPWNRGFFLFCHARYSDNWVHSASYSMSGARNCDLVSCLSLILVDGFWLIWLSVGVLERMTISWLHWQSSWKSWQLRGLSFLPICEPSVGALLFHSLERTYSEPPLDLRRGKEASFER